MKYLILSFCILFSGCAGDPSLFDVGRMFFSIFNPKPKSTMLIPNNQVLQPIDTSASQVVFIRYSYIGSSKNAYLFDVTDDEPKFVGIISNDTKIAYKTVPGKHLFMITSKEAEFMKAELGNGKTYFSIITPHMGLLKEGFSMRPIRGDGTTKYNTSTEKFRRWLDKTKLIVNSEQSTQWFMSNLKSIKNKKLVYWPKWKKQSGSDKVKHTLNEEDGMIFLGL